ncbi:hypothetical protein PR202_ga18995 [Eleusine coracana subsp. coracana]|uniref:Tyrosinase copper-binding domain-containing protein n=1 Tax=Eleusine coracana subsp. coracana TaxID=191504 RepID=A0AAV5CTB7_ELECO|nr:hypothetical protein PR202_ga18995 [Eleusine coracana subsp. coracana]
MVSGAKKPELFFGQPYRQGDNPDPGPGNLENVPHGTIHFWTGDPRQPNGEDMGNFYSAARDPVFFAHHANVDLMWHLWRTRLHNDNNNNTSFTTDADWLDAAFLFYDEDARLVRCRVRDALDTAALRYAYQDVALPWLNAKPVAVAKEESTSGAAAARAITATTATALPARLDGTVSVVVARPETSRTAKRKAEAEEVLVVDGIEVADRFRFVKFDVFVNAASAAAATQSGGAARCAGSVALAPHVVRGEGDDKSEKKGRAVVKTAARFGICDLLDDTGADGDGAIVVSLVPRAAGDTVTVGGVRIDYVK